MATRLTNLRIKRVALVDQGADQDAHMVLWKRHSPVNKEKDVTVNLDALPEALRKHFEGSEQDIVDAVASAIAAQSNADEVAKLQATIAELNEKLEAAGQSDEADVTKGMSDEVRKAFEAERAERIEMQKRLDAEVEKNAIRDYTEIAKKYDTIPGADASKLGPVLYRLNKNALSEEDRTFITELLDAATGVVKQNGLLLGELGRSGAGSGESDPLEKIAKRFRDADPSLSEAESYDKALQTPEGAAAYAEYARGRAVLD